jgi:hypothetical protein
MPEAYDTITPFAYRSDMCSHPAASLSGRSVPGRGGLER